MENAELLRRCRQGDELAWEALVRRFQGRVYGIALHYLRDAEEARDLAQEIFVRVYRKLGTYRDEDAFLPWLLRVARNACIDHLRRQAARPSGSAVPIDSAGEVADPGASPEGDASASQRSRYGSKPRLTIATWRPGRGGPPSPSTLRKTSPHQLG